MMLEQIVLITVLLFGFGYPLFFVGDYQETVKSGFYRFNLGTVNVVLGVAILPLWWSGAPQTVKVATTVCFVLLLAVTAFSWRRETVNRLLLVLPALPAGAYRIPNEIA